MTPAESWRGTRCRTPADSGRREALTVHVRSARLLHPVRVGILSRRNGMIPTMTTKNSETRFTIGRQATFALAFSIVADCGYDSSYSAAPPAPDPAFEDALWTVSAGSPAILHLAPTQLLTDGNRTPATSISTPSAQLSELNGIAFDADGTMWVTSQHDSTLVAFAPTSLERLSSSSGDHLGVR